MQTSNDPKITLVTPSLNSAHTIRETILSVREQDYKNVEHLILDGGSTDGTLDILREYPHLIWISEKDEGHYHAMNKGIQMATGEAVAILNADDCYCEGVLTKVAAALRAHPEWDGLFGDIIFVDDHGREIFRREEACWDPQIVRFGFGVAQHQTLFVRKRTYQRLGGLRYKDFKNSCDLEFLTRMAFANCSIGHIRAYVVRYRYHQHGQSADKRVVMNMARESARIRAEYGVPGGVVGKMLGYYARLKRQAEKLIVLGKCDLIPGGWHLRKHMRDKTEFSSNIGLDKL
ncbi:MAG: glycosyltransferase family 2 protein [Verrucomicrobiota bacterium]|jgi:glycosyltransferase involved in cell wall biosynthesis